MKILDRLILFIGIVLAVEDNVFDDTDSKVIKLTTAMYDSDVVD